MKLELKHLAPYLPYGLKCEIITVTDNIMIEKLTGFENRMSDYAIFGNVKNGTNGVGIFGHCKLLFSSVKPILRPLSDLAKEIEVINPICFKWVQLNDLNEIKLDTYNFLVKNHYDIFGLIDQNLAISIHDVQ